MNDAALTPFSRTVEFVFRLGYWAGRLGAAPRPDSLPDIIVSRKLGLVCAAIPLCGTRTLKNLFLSDEPTFQARLLRESVPDVLRRKTGGEVPLLFSVVRNPWSRVVSCYEKKIRGAIYMKPTYYRAYKSIVLISGHDGLSAHMSFDQFVEWLSDERGRDNVANRHWMSQYTFLGLPELESSYFRLIRLESLARELNSLLSQIGLPAQIIEKSNSSGGTISGRLHDTTREYYTSKRTINLVGDRYAEDIKLFGYDF